MPENYHWKTEYDNEDMANRPLAGGAGNGRAGGTSDLALKRSARLAQGWIGAGNDIDEVPEILSKLNDWRAEFGRDQEPFETVIAVRQLEQVEAVKKLEEQGMTSAVYGFSDYRMPLADKLKEMELFAEHLMPLLA